MQELTEHTNFCHMYTAFHSLGQTFSALKENATRTIFDCETGLLIAATASSRPMQTDLLACDGRLMQYPPLGARCPGAAWSSEGCQAALDDVSGASCHQACMYYRHGTVAQLVEMLHN